MSFMRLLAENIGLMAVHEIDAHLYMLKNFSKRRGTLNFMSIPRGRAGASK